MRTMVLRNRLSFCDILAVVLVALTAVTHCNTLQDKAKWFDPCGTGGNRRMEPKVPLNKMMWIRQLAKSFRIIEEQLNVTIEHYNQQNFNESYKDVRGGVDEEQYVLTWVPGKGNVLIHFDRPTRRKISGYLPGLHTELQQFAVAMEAIIQRDPMRTIVADTNTYLIQLLCEVEDALVVLQISIPAREQRSLMTDEERNPPDETRRLIRDWGIIFKYRDYLHSWRDLLDKMEKRHRRRNARKQRPKRRS